MTQFVVCRRRLVCLAMALAALPLLETGTAARSGAPPAAAPDIRPLRLGLPEPARAHVSAVMGRDEATYHAVSRGDGFRMENARHGLRAEFTRAGVHVAAGTTRWRLSLAGYGYVDEPRTIVAVPPQATGNRIEYRRGALTEWYLNGPLGLEQGFTLTAPPRERRAGPLTLAFTVSGNESLGDVVCFARPRRSQRP